jgi:hypothetical protein
LSASSPHHTHVQIADLDGSFIYHGLLKGFPEERHLVLALPGPNNAGQVNLWSYLQTPSLSIGIVGGVQGQRMLEWLDEELPRRGWTQHKSSDATHLVLQSLSWTYQTSLDLLVLEVIAIPEGLFEKALIEADRSLGSRPRELESVPLAPFGLTALLWLGWPHTSKLEPHLRDVCTAIEALGDQARELWRGFDSYAVASGRVPDVIIDTIIDELGHGVMSANLAASYADYQKSKASAGVDEHQAPEHR